MKNILNVPFSTKNMHDTTLLLSQHMDRDLGPLHVVTANPEIVMQANRNIAFMDVLQKADLITPDGIGIVMAAKLLGEPIEERVAGYDLLHSILTYRRKKNKKVKIFALGAKEETIALACKNLKKQYENVEIVGFRNGYFQKEQEQKIVAEIAQTKPDLLLVGLGAPKQELFIANYKHQLNAKVLIGCGGTFDVLSGNVKRAPALFQAWHLEWFWRLLTHPKRIVRQFDLVRFLIEVKKEKRRIHRNES